VGLTALVRAAAADWIMRLHCSKCFVAEERNSGFFACPHLARIYHLGSGPLPAKRARDLDPLVRRLSSGLNALLCLSL